MEKSFCRSPSTRCPEESLYRNRNDDEIRVDDVLVELLLTGVRRGWNTAGRHSFYRRHRRRCGVRGALGGAMRLSFNGKIAEVRSLRRSRRWCSGRNLSPEGGLLGAGASGRVCPLGGLPEFCADPCRGRPSKRPQMKVMTARRIHSFQWQCLNTHDPPLPMPEFLQIEADLELL